MLPQYTLWFGNSLVKRSNMLIVALFFVFSHSPLPVAAQIHVFFNWNSRDWRFIQTAGRYTAGAGKSNKEQTIKGNQAWRNPRLSGFLVTYQCGEAVVAIKLGRLLAGVVQSVVFSRFSLCRQSEGQIICGFVQHRTGLLLAWRERYTQLPSGNAVRQYQHGY